MGSRRIKVPSGTTFESSISQDSPNRLRNPPVGLAHQWVSSSREEKDDQIQEGLRILFDLLDRPLEMDSFAASQPVTVVEMITRPVR
jgi:hypothetical protein